MTAREPRREAVPEKAAPTGIVGSTLPTSSFSALTADERLEVLTKVLDYRGDVTLRLDDGSSIVGYVFSVEPRAAEPHVRLMTAESGEERVRVPLARIVGAEFTGRDTADGRSWEAWTRRYEERKRLRAEGIEVGDIEPQPDEL